MQYVLIGLIIFLALFLQASITTVPLLLVIIVLLYIFYRTTWIFFLAFFAGILFDTVSVRPIGLTSIFLLVFLLCVFLYQKKFEIGSYYFIGFMLFVAGIVYAWMYMLSFGFFIGCSCALLGILCFYVSGIISEER
jgi:cell shape-determining protein MreD